MAKHAVLASVTIAAICCLGGCGTLANVCGPKTIYGGTSTTALGPLAMFQSAFEPRTGQTSELALAGARAGLIVTGLYMGLVDLPLCIIADTLTLPVTIPASINRTTQDYYFPSHPSDVMPGLDQPQSP